MTKCVHIAVFLGVLVKSTVQQGGRQISDCVWEYDDGKRLDLTGIGNTDGTAKWTNKTAQDLNQDPNLYNINPCHGFTLGTECQDVTVCRISNLGIPLNIGDVSSGRMYLNEDDSNVVLEYNHTDSNDPNLIYTSRFSHSCNNDFNEDQVWVLGVQESTPTHVLHRFILLTPCVATISPSAGSPPPASMSAHPIRTVTAPHTVTHVTVGPPSGPHGLSGGGIICILFVCFVCAYFLIGAAYMFFFSGARGMEIIPNVHFWIDLPNLIMDGFFFLFSCCAPTRMVSSSTDIYDKI